MTLYNVSIGDRNYRVQFDGRQALVDGLPVQLDLTPLSGGLHLLRQGEKAVELLIARLEGQTYQVLLGARQVTARVTPGNRPAAAGVSASRGAVTAPMPGILISVAVAEGQPVVEGQVVAVLESMKMQMQLRAPSSGTVRGVSTAAGRQVEKGALLVQIEPEA